MKLEKNMETMRSGSREISQGASALIAQQKENGPKNPSLTGVTFVYTEIFLEAIPGTCALSAISPEQPAPGFVEVAEEESANELSARPELPAFVQTVLRQIRDITK